MCFSIFRFLRFFNFLILLGLSTHSRTQYTGHRTTAQQYTDDPMMNVLIGTPINSNNFTEFELKSKNVKTGILTY